MRHCEGTRWQPTSHLRRWAARCSGVAIGIALLAPAARADWTLPPLPAWGTSLERVQESIPGGATASRDGVDVYGVVKAKKANPTLLYTLLFDRKLGLYAVTIAFLYEDARVDLTSDKFETMTLADARRQRTLLRPGLVRQYGKPKVTDSDSDAWESTDGGVVHLAIQPAGSDQGVAMLLLMSKQGLDRQRRLGGP